MSKEQQYHDLKDSILISEKSLVERQSQISKIDEQIQRDNDLLIALKAKLKAEDLALSRNSRLKPPTMDLVEYESVKASIGQIEASIPELQSELDFHKRGLILNQAELRDRRIAFDSTKNSLLVGLVDQCLAEISASSREQISRLVKLIVAIEGRAKGFRQTELFNNHIGKTILEQILPIVFEGGVLPDLPEANQFANEILDKSAAQAVE